MPGRFASGAIMKRGTAYAPKASGAETASTTHPSIDTGDAGVLYVEINVTAASGTTPTMTVVVEGSNDGSNWFQLGIIGANGYSQGTTAPTPSSFTAAATARSCFPAMQYVRTRSVIAGTTPSFTYSIALEAN